jgi:hypothetical protein
MRLLTGDLKSQRSLSIATPLLQIDAQSSWRSNFGCLRQHRQHRLPAVKGTYFGMATKPARRLPSEASSAASFDHLVGQSEQIFQHLEASAFAVLRLMTNSDLVGCCTGKSEALVPLRMRST